MGEGESLTVRPLSNDDLGDKGESRFAELCAGLTANRVTRDRAGFDYIVDFRLPSDLRRLDSRPAPISARVQVKTYWADRDEIRLRLSAAEQLVKHSGPSFICALAVSPSEDPTFARMHVIHCRGEVVQRVLKRLRQAEASGQKPNKLWLTLKPSDFSPALDVRPSELKKALEQACKPDALSYLSTKDAELKSVGFGPDAHQLKVNFSCEADEIIDAFLGLRPLDVTEVIETHTRFGISLPGDTLPPGPARLEISPQPERCDVTVRVDATTFRFKGKCFRTPNLIDTAFGRSKLLIRAGLLQVTLIFNEPSFTATFARDKNIELEAVRRITEWRDLYAILGAITEQGAAFAISSPKAKDPFRLFAQVSDAETGKEWQKLARLSQASARVFHRAGRPNAKESLQNLWEAGDELTTLAAIIHAPETVTGISFTTEKSIVLPRHEPIEMLLGHAFKVGNKVIAFGVAMTVTAEEREDDLVWSAPKLQLLDVHSIRSQADFQKFLTGLPQRPFRVVTGLYQSLKPTIYAISKP